MSASRCALCPGIHKCIKPDGPEDCDILFLGEAPGINEEKQNRVFIGKTGEEVNRHYLPLAGMRREHVTFTNCIRCLPTSAGGKLDPKRRKDLALLESCAQHHLYPLIERRRPRILVPMGAFACRALSPAIDLELHHGYPQTTPYGVAFPMYHPALGMHEPKRMLHIRTDWQRLRRYLAGTLVLPQDPYPEPDYAEVTDVAEIQALDPKRPLACDTESKRGGTPFCLTYSQDCGTGRLIRAQRHDLVGAFQAQLAHWHSPILFHNWLYDWSVVETMGLRFPLSRIVDTMVRVYHLGNLPQGLKALAWRELGMTMQDFDDVVTPYSKQLVLQYYHAASLEKWERPEAQMVRGADGLWKLYRPQSMNTKLKRFFTDFQSSEDKDVFEMWEKNWVKDHGQLDERCGTYPGKCISHVPFEEALHYACRDADSLIRLWPLIQHMSARVRHAPQEKWRDA